MTFSPTKQLFPITIFPKTSDLSGYKSFILLSCVTNVTLVETVTLLPILINYGSLVIGEEQSKQSFPIFTPRNDNNRTVSHDYEIFFLLLLPSNNLSLPLLSLSILLLIFQITHSFLNYLFFIKNILYMSSAC